MKPEEIVYIFDDNLCSECNRLPVVEGRANMVHELISSYGLLKKLTVVKSTPATEDELKLCHSTAYVEFLRKINDSEDLEQFEDEQEEFGLSYDCQPMERCHDLATALAGGSATAAKVLNGKQHKVAINWFGGWHHAQRDGAEGFCYVNDVVVALQILKAEFPRILYVDLDIHHGNGVQNAFELSTNVLTLSLHKVSPGFYPGSGGLDDTGFQKGKYYSINVPFKDNLGDQVHIKVFNSVFPRICDVFKPEAIVVQCGADGLMGDPLGECNLTLEAFKNSIEKILGMELPTLLLGGGGYNFPNAARLWAYITSLACKEAISNDIPDTIEDYPEYAPSYELEIEAGRRKDANDANHIFEIIRKIWEYCEIINFYSLRLDTSADT